MTMSISARLDRLVDDLASLSLSVEVKEKLEAAAEAFARVENEKAQEHYAALSAAALSGADRNHGVVVTIPIPSNYAGRFPDPVIHNHGHEPHLTVLYVANEMSAGQASDVLHLVRKACKTIPPFRMFVDAQSGLNDFGNTDAGEKALWLSARSEPRGEVERLHRVIRQLLEREGMKIEAHKDFTPHVTWAYVPNDVADEDRRRMDNHVSDRFDRGFWFDVRQLEVSLPDGRTKAIALSPIPRKSVY